MPNATYRYSVYHLAHFDDSGFWQAPSITYHTLRVFAWDAAKGLAKIQYCGHHVRNGNGPGYITTVHEDKLTRDAPEKLPEVNNNRRWTPYKDD